MDSHENGNDDCDLAILSRSENPEMMGVDFFLQAQ